MKKINLTPQNAFLGAEVTLNGKTLYVVKINEKSLYASSEPSFLAAWEGKSKGVTWKNFCEGHQAKSYKYDGFEIAEEEAAKKAEIEAKSQLKKEQVQHISGQLRAEVKKSWKRFVEKETKGKGKAWQYPIESGDKRVCPVAASIQAEAMLLNINSNYMFYFVNDEVYVPFDKKEHKDGKDIVWPVSPLEEIKK